MKICHVQYSFAIENGGPARSLSNYCRGQVAAGHEVSLWTLEGFPQWPSAIRLPPPVEMRVFRVEPPTKLGRSAEMRRQLRRAGSPDIYHLHGVWLQAMHYGADEARRRNRPYVLETAGMYEPLGLRQKWLPKRVARWWFQDRILHEAACLHVNSNQEAENIRELGFKAPIAVIPVGVDLENIEKRKAEILKLESEGQFRHLTPALSPVEAERERKVEMLPGEVAKQPAGIQNGFHRPKGLHGPREAETLESEAGSQKSEVSRPSSVVCRPISEQLAGRPFILYLSRIHPKKGLDLLIRAYAKTRKSEIGNRKSDDWMLVIAGSGEQSYVDRCRRLAAELGVANQCLWLGHVDELQKSWLFTHAHSYVLPTSSENFGNTVAESLAHGTPVITTIHTPWKELEERGCGWFVDNTETEVGRALHEVFALDAVSRGRMSESGQRLVRERYSLGAVLKDINAVYEWLSGRGDIPACVQLEQAGATFSTPFARPSGDEAEARLKSQAEVTLLFDQKAATWNRKYGPHGALRPRLHAFEKQLSELLKPPATVLDFGCGTGDLACHLSACGYALSACDMSHDMMAWARKINPKALVTWELLPAGGGKCPLRPTALTPSQLRASLNICPTWKLC